MNKRFLDFINAHELFSQQDKLLAGVSGGVDSVVLCHLLKSNGFHFDIAHVNFKLRGSDSDEDEAFVRELAGFYGSGSHFIDFDTRSIAAQEKISIEMAARKLRFEWFSELCETHGYHVVVLAHHLNDSIETVILNQAKGTGIRGLHGILPKRNHIVRPLLDFTREEIEAYAKEHSLSFRIDVSNYDETFQRNRIRQHVVPELKKINPNLEAVFRQNIEHILEYEAFVDLAIAEIKAAIETSSEDEMLKIDLAKIGKHPFKQLILFEILKTYGFNRNQVNDLVDSFEKGSSGVQFQSKDFLLTKDRSAIVLEQNVRADPGEIWIEENQQRATFNDYEFEIETTSFKKIEDLKDPCKAYLNAKMVKFPIVIRKWQRGDYFFPYGMEQGKKLSDFFIDEKVPVHMKHRIPVFTIGKKICWIAGHRIDNRFKITEDCDKVLKIAMKRKK